MRYSIDIADSVTIPTESDLLYREFLGTQHIVDLLSRCVFKGRFKA